MRSLEGGNQLRNGGITQSPDSTLSNLHLRLVSPNSGSQARPSSISPFRVSLFGALLNLADPYSPCDQDDDTKRIPSYSDQEKRKGRTESDKSASEKHCGPHCLAAGGGVEAWPREENGGARQLERLRGVATRPR